MTLFQYNTFTSTDDILAFWNRQRVKRATFNVVCAETLPTSIQMYDFVVTNTDRCSKGTGTHWVAFDCRSTPVLFFDSFGFPAKHYFPLLPFHAITYNNHAIQDIHSTVCGQFATFFCIVQSNNLNIYNYVQRTSPVHNSHLMLQLFD